MKLLTLTLFLLLLTGCSTQPTDFETGHETLPPMGCIEYRARGGEC